MERKEEEGSSLSTTLKGAAYQFPFHSSIFPFSLLSESTVQKKFTMKRVEALLQQFAPQRDESKHLLQSKWTACGVKNDDDIVVVAPLRTANTKARRGAFAKVPVEELLSFAMKVRRLAKTSIPLWSCWICGMFFGATADMRS